MRLLKRSVQAIFYLLILCLFVSRSASSGFSHDENQFIASGQLLADRHLLPYVDYPFTHVPYGVAFYGLSAALSDYDFLAGRLFNALAWAICAILIILIVRLFSRRQHSDPSLPQLFAEFILVLIFLDHPIMAHIDGVALNHSFATLFGLLALFFFGRALQLSANVRRASFASGAFAGLATFIRLNYAALGAVLLVVWILYAFTISSSHWRSSALPYLAGLAAASIPAVIIAAVAPQHFLYSNVVYIRLNTIYYHEMGYRLNMTIISKLQSFLGMLQQSPVDIILYGALAFFAVAASVRYVKTPSAASLLDLALGGFALALALSAFAPTPTQPQYFFAPLPFLLVILGVLIARLERMNLYAGLAAPAIALVALFATTRIPNPVAEIAFLSRPSQWTAVQIHDFDVSLKQYVHDGRFLSLLPMLPLEAGYDVYPFTAAGSFPWRTSLLLTPERRLQYGVTSPEELSQLLQDDPPSGILTKLESTNDGFVRNDLGGLETPFVDYAAAHGYRSVPLSAKFLRRTVILWIKQP